MLKFVIILFAISLSHCVYSQHSKTDYIQMVDSSKKWVNVQHIWGSVTYSGAIIFSSDSIIEDIEYVKVFHSADQSQELYELIGFARETPDKKVFFLPLSQDQEYLIYDFGANVNDTIAVAELTVLEDNVGVFYNEDYPVIITSIDTVYFAEQNRKRLHIHHGADHWIEGVGSMKGMFKNEFLLVGYNNKLLCYYEDDIVLYQDSEFNTCLISTDIQTANINFETDIIVYPNPSSENFTIKIVPIQEHKMQVSIYDITGKFVKTKPLICSETLIETSEWPAGIYNCVFFINGQPMEIKKIIY